MTISTLSRTIIIAAATGCGGYFVGNMNQSTGASLAAQSVQSPAATTVQKSSSQRSEQLPETQATSAEASAKNHPRIASEAESKLLTLLREMEADPRKFSHGEGLVAWLVANPDEVVAFLAPSAQRDQAFSQLFALWAKQDPLAASQWVADHPSAPGRDGMAAGLASGVAKEDTQAALKWAASIKDPLLKLNAAGEVGWELYRASEASAVEGVKGLGLPDSALEPLQAKWHQRFSAVTKRNSQNICSTATAARAAGAKLDTSSLESALAALRNGISGDGAFKTTQFKLSNETWTERERAAISQHVQLRDGMMIYEAGN